MRNRKETGLDGRQRGGPDGRKTESLRRVRPPLAGPARATATALGALLLLAGCSTVEEAVDNAPSATGTSGSAQPGESAPAAGGAGSGHAVSPLDNPDGTKPGLAPVSSADRAEALAVLKKVETKGRGPRTGYDRDEFGYAWMDSAPGGIPYAHNGCDTRIISMLRRLIVEFSQLIQGAVRYA